MRINAKRVKIELIKQERSIPWLAGELGVTKQALYGALNNGAKTLGVIDRIAKALGVPAKDLIIED